MKKLLLLFFAIAAFTQLHAQIITTVAGTGAFGYNGDNIAADTAILGSLWDVAVDAAGNLFISDRANSRIRKVDLNGIITTVAGTGVAGHSGDGGPAVHGMIRPFALCLDDTGNIYFSEGPGGVYVREVNAASGNISTIAGVLTGGSDSDNIPALMANLDGPRGLVAFNNKVYLAE